VKGNKKRLFVFSVDSLFYEDIPWIKECPHLSRLFERGSYIKGMLSTYPSMTYVAHTTILTGCHPETHGIFHNEKVQVGVKHPDWYWFRRDIKCPTFLDAAKAAGYRSMVVSWPVTGSDPSVDYLIPEIWPGDFEGDMSASFESACSPGAMDLFNKYHKILRWKEQPELDIFGANCVIDIIREHQPEIIMLHFSYLDSARHKNGLYAARARDALLACDFRFGRICDALREAGVYDDTNFVVIGDHGHLPVNQVFNPNIRLVKAGLITLDGGGSIADWDAYCHSAGLSCQVSLRDTGDAKTRAKLQAILGEMAADEAAGCERILDKAELKKRCHLEGPFDYCIESRAGTAFGNNCTGSEIISTDNSDYKLSVASHGHLPEKGPQPILFAAGPQIRQGQKLSPGNLIDEGPTFAAILGLEMPHAQGRAIESLLW
jgi:predicted AlkP superfamily pyrophosphatase or phosphodiesterase